MYVRMYVCMYVCVCIYIYIYMYILYVCVCVHACMYNVYACVYELLSSTFISRLYQRRRYFHKRNQATVKIKWPFARVCLYFQFQSLSF